MAFVSIPEAARRLDASESTIRRKIRAGELRAIQEETIQGYRWLVEVADDQVRTTGDHLSTNDDHLSTSMVQLHPLDAHSAADKEIVTRNEQVATSDQVRTAGDHLPTTTLLDELRRLHDQNVQLAGQVGYLQAQLQDAREQVRMLADAQHAQEPLATDPKAEATQQRIPWWRRLLGR